MNILKLPEWFGDIDCTDGILVNFDHVIKIEDALYTEEADKYMAPRKGDGWREEFIDKDFDKSKITFSNGESVLVDASVEQILRGLEDCIK